MKTKKIAEFKNENVKITVVRNFDIYEHKLYSVTETPVNKNAKWKETTKEFAYTHEWVEFMQEKINFWLG